MDRLKGKWLQFKGEVKKRWGKLIDDDLRQIEGNYEKVIGMLLAGELNLSVEVDRSPVPALRDDAIKDCPGPMLIINPRQ